MTDDEILAHYREIHPWTTLSEAKAVHRIWQKFRHLGAHKEAKTREAERVHRQRLRDQLFKPDSDASEGDGQ